MKKTLAVILAMVMVLSAIPLAFAEDVVEETPITEEVTEETPVVEETTEEVVATTNETIEVPAEVTEEAGITPDSPLYGIERALERINLALTFGKAAKAKKGLAHASERLMEVQKMIAEKKLKHAEKAQKAYEDAVAEVEDNMEEMGDGDAEQELADQVEIEDLVAKNTKVVQQIGNVTLRLGKSLTAEEKAKLQEAIASLEGINSAFKVKVLANKNRIKIKIKAAKGATDEEIAALENALREGSPLAKVRIVKTVKQGEGVIKEQVKEQVKEKIKSRVKNETEDDAEDEEAPETEDTDAEDTEVEDTEANDTEVEED